MSWTDLDCRGPCPGRKGVGSRVPCRGHQSLRPGSRRAVARRLQGPCCPRLQGSPGSRGPDRGGFSAVPVAGVGGVAPPVPNQDPVPCPSCLQASPPWCLGLEQHRNNRGCRQQGPGPGQWPGFALPLVPGGFPRAGGSYVCITYQPFYHHFRCPIPTQADQNALLSRHTWPILKPRSPYPGQGKAHPGLFPGRSGALGADILARTRAWFPRTLAGPLVRILCDASHRGFLTESPTKWQDCGVDGRTVRARRRRGRPQGAPQPRCSYGGSRRMPTGKLSAP